ncbi:MAG: dienelactone hydrolase family protein [Planctomycetia bacterium]|nr:dienelactone hydrolase family protein [Planctomycetia bacterium]
MKRIATLIFAIIAVCFATMTVHAEENMIRGKQILKTIELPANTNIWDEDVDIAKLAQDNPISENEKEMVSYWLFVPSDDGFAENGKYPLVLFLHGAGERGQNPEAIKAHGPPKFVETDQAKSWPFITVSPQCAAGKCWSSAQLNLLLDEIEKTCPVDVTREYVTGLSMGGFGTWKMLYASPERFAAAAPVCGGVAPEKAAAFVNIPVHIFHGEADGVVSPACSTDIFNAITKAGGKKVLITTYPGVGHDSWNNAYNGSELWDWFLTQRK